MCRFLFVGVRERHLRLLLGELTGAGLTVAPADNPGVLAAFPHDDVVRTVTRAGCSCEISGEPGRRFDEHAARARYRSKGWSASKIERAILGKRPNEQPYFVAFRDSFARVVRAAETARILARWFSGDVGTEPVDLRPGGVLLLDDYLARRGTYAEDLVHDVRIR